MTTTADSTPMMMPAAEGPELSELFTVTVAGARGVVVGGAARRISLPGTGGNAARCSSIGMVMVRLARLTESVQRAPSQYRPSVVEVAP